MSHHMMADPLALGAEYQLGNCKATSQPHQLTRQDIAVLIALGLLMLSVYLSCFYFFAMPLTNKIIGSIIITFCVSLVQGYSIWDIYRNQALCVFFYDNGLIHRGRTSFQTIIYWQHVQSVIHKVKVVSTEYDSRTVHIYTLNCSNGTSLRLDDRTFPGLEQLMIPLEVEIARNLFPTALSAYQKGFAVLFGPLAITQEGVRYKKRVFPWSVVKGISTDGQIWIRKQGKRRLLVIKVNPAKVPNIELFRILTQHILGAIPPES